MTVHYCCATDEADYLKATPAELKGAPVVSIDMIINGTNSGGHPRGGQVLLDHATARAFARCILELTEVSQ